MTISTLEVRRARTPATWRLGATALLLGAVGLVFMGGAVLATAIALARDLLDLQRILVATLLLGLGSWNVVSATRSVPTLRRALPRLVMLRLDAEGVHVRQAVHRGSAGAWWASVLWADVAWVASSTGMDDEKLARFLEVRGRGLLRFVVRDDRSIRLPRDLDPAAMTDFVLLLTANALGLTRSQTLLTTFLARADRQRVIEWLRENRPELPVVETDAAPWVTPTTPDPWPDEPRVAVVGAADPLGRRLVALLAIPGEPSPVAVVRNEAHRSGLEQAGAEVRMLDMDFAPLHWCRTTLLGCQTVVVTSIGMVTLDLLEVCREPGRRVVMVDDGRFGRHPDPAWLDGVDWTVLRVAALTDGPGSGHVDVGEDLVAGAVPVADLADVVVSALRDPASVHGVWNVTSHPVASTS